MLLPENKFSVYKIKGNQVWLSTEEGDEVDPIEVPTEWIICGTCRGNGKHSVAVDGHGITAEERERDWDDESWQNYMDGMYDRSCEECNGSGKVRQIMFEQLPPRLQTAIEQYWEEEADYRRTCEAERRFGC